MNLPEPHPTPERPIHQAPPRGVPYPHRVPRIQHVMDEFGERTVLVFPCERCGQGQFYRVLDKASHCARCEGVVPQTNESTAA